ncbi:hypothetical protein BKA65DRAFT_16554 [Rhexocercosporidium sp. MPI-PUGE-AT-0058]|nr:hypothetical protein BKA65DRAFT_16554 [Rhexocercosporidium sp. MPI-PUGE-AT-0058]
MPAPVDSRLGTALVIQADGSSIDQNFPTTSVTSTLDSLSRMLAPGSDRSHTHQDLDSTSSLPRPVMDDFQSSNVDYGSRSISPNSQYDPQSMELTNHIKPSTPREEANSKPGPSHVPLERKDSRGTTPQPVFHKSRSDAQTDPHHTSTILPPKDISDLADQLENDPQHNVFVNERRLADAQYQHREQVSKHSSNIREVQRMPNQPEITISAPTLEQTPELSSRREGPQSRSSETTHHQRSGGKRPDNKQYQEPSSYENQRIARRLLQQKKMPPTEYSVLTYTHTSVKHDEVQDLIRKCTKELKGRSQIPFPLLPFRPASDPMAVRQFINGFFAIPPSLHALPLEKELQTLEPLVLSGILRWCWSRLPGGIVGWEVYQLFKVGELDSRMARDSFSTFIPISVHNHAHADIIFDFFDLLSALIAHGKMNGYCGVMLPRMAAWWAFEHQGNRTFEGNYRQWLGAADATSHLFFAYLRNIARQPVMHGISMLPKSLDILLRESEYPPQNLSTMQLSATQFIMKVDNLSPGPFSLVRRAINSQGWIKNVSESARNVDPILQLTFECKRVLTIMDETTIQRLYLHGRKQTSTIGELDWSRFEDYGFSDVALYESTNPAQQDLPLSMTPPKDTHTSDFGFDETFWWVWITSQAQEETPARKEVFGRYVVIELSSRSRRWAVLEEHLEGKATLPTSSSQSMDGSSPPQKKKGSSTFSKKWSKYIS